MNIQTHLSIARTSREQLENAATGGAQRAKSGEVAAQNLLAALLHDRGDGAHPIALSRFILFKVRDLYEGFPGGPAIAETFGDYAFPLINDAKLDPAVNFLRKVYNILKQNI